MLHCMCVCVWLMWIEMRYLVWDLRNKVEFQEFKEYFLTWFHVSHTLDYIVYVSEFLIWPEMRYLVQN